MFGLPVIVDLKMDEIALLKKQIKELKNAELLKKQQKWQNQLLNIENLHNKIKAFRSQVENEGMFLKEISKNIPCSPNTVKKIAKKEKWNLEQAKARLKQIQIKNLKTINKKQNLVAKKDTPKKTIHTEILKQYINGNNELVLSVVEIAKLEKIPYRTLQSYYKKAQELKLINPKPQKIKKITKSKVEKIIEIPCLKPKIKFNEVNQFKKKIEDKPIELSNEIENEISTSKEEMQDNEYDLMEFAKKLQQKAEKDGINVKAEICKKCGNKIFFLSEEKHTCYQSKKR